MGQLQAEVHVAVGVRPEPLAVGRNEILPQRGEGELGTVAEEQLVWIRAAVVTHRDGFAAPDQFRTAFTEVAPTAPRQLAGLPLGGAVPPLHRKNAEPVAYVNAMEVEGTAERRFGRRQQRLVERDRNAVRGEVPRECFGVLQGGDTC